MAGTLKARIIYLPTVPHTVEAANRALISAREHGLDAELYPGYAPKEADDIIRHLHLKPYSPGPKIYDIKNSKPGVRGCFVSHLHLWKWCFGEAQEPVVIMEHDAIITRDIPKIDFRDILHLDAWRFEEDPDYDGEDEVDEFFELRKGQKTMRGAYAYIIKPHAAEKLVQGAMRDGYCAADMHISDRHGLKLERIAPRCAIVSDSRSLTSDRNFYQ